MTKMKPKARIGKVAMPVPVEAIAGWEEDIARLRELTGGTWHPRWTQEIARLERKVAKYKKGNHRI